MSKFFGNGRILLLLQKDGCNAILEFESNLGCAEVTTFGSQRGTPGEASFHALFHRHPLKCRKSFGSLARAGGLAAEARLCQQKVDCNLASACALLIIGENDGTHKQKSLAFGLELR